MYIDAFWGTMKGLRTRVEYRTFVVPSQKGTCILIVAFFG